MWGSRDSPAKLSHLLSYCSYSNVQLGEDPDTFNEQDTVVQVSGES